MKFRAKMNEALCMRQFSNIVTTLSRLSKICVLRLCEDKLYFIISEENSFPSRTSAWCILEKSHFFKEYSLVGHPEQNEIFLEFSSDMLSSSLASVKGSTNSAKSMKIKLTDKISPCLTLEIELPSQMANSRLCVHDVPVSLIPRREWSEYQEPPVCEFDMSIHMPSLKIVRNVVDKLKKLSHNLIISANSDETLTLKVESSKVTVATHFKDLHVEKIRGGQTSVSVLVDGRRFSNFLTCDQVNPTKVICNLVNGKLVHQYLENSDFILNYFLVGIND